MGRALALAVVIVLSSGAAAPAAEQQLLRVHEPSRPPDDQRLTETHDIDHPVDFKPKYKDKADWERRAEVLRTQILVANGLLPMPQRTPLEPVIHGKVDRGDYTLEKVFFASLPGHYVSGNLYRPAGKSDGKRPAVLCPHGHWANGRLLWNDEKTAKKQVEIGAEKTIEGAKSVLQARCAMLARMGCVVF